MGADYKKLFEYRNENETTRAEYTQALEDAFCLALGYMKAAANIFRENGLPHFAEPQSEFVKKHNPLVGIGEG